MDMSNDGGASGGSVRVIVVDPEPQDRIWLKALLSRGCGPRNVAIVECSGSTEALEALRTGPPCQLLVSELGLAQGDGIELVRGLARTGYRGAVVLASGCDPKTLAAAARLVRAHGLRLLCATSKPLLPAKVLKALAACVAGAAAKAERAWTDEELDRAFALRQFVNFYQPQVELGSGRVSGFELLVRWAHPVLGVLPAEEFIHEIEASGRADELLLATLPCALRDAGAWVRHGGGISLSVNVSPLTLRNVALPDLVEAEAAAAEFPVENIVVEVTEERPLDDPTTQFDTLLRLRLKGVELSMDDFGKGHASIESLRRLPFQEIKLDRSLVQGARRDSSFRTITEACLCTARRLGLRVIAEGVETVADVAFLRKTTCDAMQGNLLGGAMPASRVQRWVRDRPDIAAGAYLVAGRLRA